MWQMELCQVGPSARAGGGGGGGGGWPTTLVTNKIGTATAQFNTVNHAVLSLSAEEIQG
jgi:hypothetical protein